MTTKVTIAPAGGDVEVREFDLVQGSPSYKTPVVLKAGSKPVDYYLYGDHGLHLREIPSAG